ncbi:MAG: glycosyltransferase family 2 protein [Bacteroidales bacterium]|nr:glycosyltransferase family 2 protein [Bacteroidales bacterium]MBN2818733.1 glycosyltransferase family 2 protein [Bacteroidales bacterium]
MPPKISVILPFFNSRERLGAAILSILNQSFEDFELLLINNNADEITHKIAFEFSSLDSRVHVIEEGAKNRVHAYNVGIEYSDSDYVAIMNEYDLAYPNRFEIQYNYLSNYAETDLVGCLIKPMEIDDYLSSSEHVLHYINWINRIISHEDILANRFIEMPIVPQTMLFRKKLADFSVFLSNIDCGGEYEFLLYLLQQGIKTYKIPEHLMEWSYTFERICPVSDKAFEQGLFETKSRYLFDWLKENNPHFPEIVVWGAGAKSRLRYLILHELGINAHFFIDKHPNATKNVIQYQETPAPGNHFIVCYIQNRISRENIRVFLIELGYVEGKDFICAC